MRILTIVLLLAASALAFATADVAGSWQVSVDTPNGKFESTVDLKQDGDKLTGTLHNQFGDSAMTGSVKENEVTLSQKLEMNGQSFSILYTGKVDGTKMSGKIKFGDQGEADWAAEKK